MALEAATFCVTLLSRQFSDIEISMTTGIFFKLNILNEIFLNSFSNLNLFRQI